jgi:hypothetical protein
MALGKRQVFYSFHFDKDVMRTQLVRNMGVVEGDTPASPNEWEQLKKKDGGQKKWIDDNMRGRSCVIVLVGEETHARPWVKYEIEKAFSEKKGLFGIYVHNLRDPNTGVGRQGTNPFEQYTIKGGMNDGKKMSAVIPCYNPLSADAYGDISKKIIGWIETAISAQKG